MAKRKRDSGRRSHSSPAHKEAADRDQPLAAQTSEGRLRRSSRLRSDHVKGPPSQLKGRVGSPATFYEASAIQDSRRKRKQDRSLGRIPLTKQCIADTTENIESRSGPIGQEKNRNSLKRNWETPEADLPHSPKRRKANPTDPIPSHSHIQSWLGSIPSGHKEEGLQEAIYQDPIYQDNMAPKRSLDSPSTLAPTDASGKSSKTSVDVNAATFRDSAKLRSVYIYKRKPPDLLMQRAKDILSSRRGSPELADAIATQLTEIAESMEDEPEDAIVQKLVAPLIPAIQYLPDSRLYSVPNQTWTHAVPVPITSYMIPSNCLPLSKPKPDCSIGFSESAFTVQQVRAIPLLDDDSGRSFAKPDKRVLLPFLIIEYKAGSKGGTHHTATNQVANAGAVVLQGHLELIRRSSSLEDFDFNEPRCFSITLDEMIVRINLHWVKRMESSEEFEYHVTKVALYCIHRDNEVKEVQRAVKNILDYGLTKLLPILSKDLDNLRNRMLDRQEQETSNDQSKLAEERVDDDNPEEAERMKKRSRKRPAVGNRRKGTSAKKTANQPTELQSWTQYFRAFWTSSA